MGEYAPPPRPLLRHPLANRPPARSLTVDVRLPPAAVAERPRPGPADYAAPVESTEPEEQPGQG